MIRTYQKRKKKRKRRKIRSDNKNAAVPHFTAIKESGIMQFAAGISCMEASGI